MENNTENEQENDNLANRSSLENSSAENKSIENRNTDNYEQVRDEHVYKFNR